MTTPQQLDATQCIVDRLAECGIRLVASLPDDWVSDLIDTIDRDPRFLHVPVNREESAVGLCSGAFFGGLPSLALMGASGLMTIVYAITKINYTYHIPLFILTTLRGRIGDPRARHISNGLYLEPLMQAISLPYLVVDTREAFERIPQAFRHSRVMNHPTVVAFTEPALRGEA
jgi:sulfopyruvate decarboxylase TPP-binding subunit